MSSSDQEHNPIKSIIYGNQVKNSYGNFRAFCAAISSHEQIEKIITYLRTNSKFQKYNRFTYAYRVYEQQTFFVTQDQPNPIPENRLLEGFSEDQTIEGSGEKLIHLLQKFNVENVLIISAIEQFNPLNKFETTHFRIIVERAKDLLNNLYTRVIQSESPQTEIVRFQQGILTGGVIKQEVKMQVTKLQVPLIQQQPKFARSQDKQANRPSHFLSEGKPNFLIKAKKKYVDGQYPPISKSLKIKELNQRLKNSAYSLEKILQQLSEREYLQLKFIVKYDQNKLIDKVFSLLMIICDIHSKDILMKEFDFKQSLETMTVNNLDDLKVRKINDIMRGDKQLNVYQLAEVNPLISTLFAFIILLVKSYESGKKLIKLINYDQQTEQYQQKKTDQTQVQDNNLIKTDGKQITVLEKSETRQDTTDIKIELQSKLVH